MAARSRPARRERRRPVPALIGLALALLLLGCGARGTTASRSEGVSGSIDVAAAASLQGAFGAMRTAFLAAHPGVAVALDLAASSTLAQQVISGAPIDVFASADEPNMRKVFDAGALEEPAQVFATNSLQIIVRKGNPSRIESLTDLARPGLVVVSCAPAVPIGRYTADLLSRAGVIVRFASLEPDVKGIVTKVVAGEADAGIVYETDVRAANGAAMGVAIAPDLDVIARYPIARIAQSSNPVTAQAWIDFVLSAEGRAILESFGFGVP